MPNEHPHSRLQLANRTAAWLLGGYLAALALIAFWPSPVDRPASGQLNGLLAALQRHGFPVWVDYSFVEGLANVLLFIPMGLLAAWLLPRGKWWQAIVVGLVASNLIEMGQLLFLGGRVASVHDIMVNTLGTIIGAGAVAAHRYNAELNKWVRTALGSFHDR
ncbi:VanZ family protein [Pseudarthrobacter sp. P1]|uniref:VanZ family protein n=1 Tax=Pseudarthrobacter sp. P1 TaxID=3418418 RepID=UPI003CF7DC8D